MVTDSIRQKKKGGAGRKASKKQRVGHTEPCPQKALLGVPSIGAGIRPRNSKSDGRSSVGKLDPSVSSPLHIASAFSLLLP